MPREISTNNINNDIATNTDTDAKFYRKLEKQLQPLTLQANDNSETLNKQEIEISSTKAYYDECLQKMSINNTKN